MQKINNHHTGCFYCIKPMRGLVSNHKNELIEVKSVYHGNELKIVKRLTNHCRSLPSCLQLNVIPGVLPFESWPPLCHTVLPETHTEKKAVIFFLLHICLPYSELRCGQRGYVSFLSSFPFLLSSPVRRWITVPPLCLLSPSSASP